MNRRKFILLLGGAVGAWPLAARAQQPSMPVIGFLSSRSEIDSVLHVAAFRRLEIGEMQVAARAVGRNLIILNASTESEIDAAFASLVQRRVGALVVTGDPLFVSQRDKVVTLAARHAVPTIYVQREFAVAGGLIGYGTSLTDAYRQSPTWSAAGST